MEDTLRTDDPPGWRLKLKLHFISDIRIVAIDRETSFSKLVTRIMSDFNFDSDPTLRYQDADGDLILLTCQNDLNELLAFAREAAQSTVVVYVQPAAAIGRVAEALATPTPSTSAIQLVPLTASALRGGSSPTSSETYHQLALVRQSSAVVVGGLPSSVGTLQLPPRARDGNKSISQAPNPRGGTSLTTSSDAPGIAFRWRRGDQILGQGAFGTV